MAAPGIHTLDVDIPGIIATKRDGGTLDETQIRDFIKAYVTGGASDAQTAALLMAICWQDLTATELSWWTDAMLLSGERLTWPTDPRPVVDKHSTGGVGDKVSLVLAPLLAVAGCRVPMLSGRGLGITGGTLDKLEALSGFRTQFNTYDLHRMLDEVGCFIAGATGNLVPADAKMYALRDVTGTVPSAALIASSIMSKKIAGGASALVIDVTWGSGGPSATLEKAADLADRMLAIGSSYQLPVTAALTPMSTLRGRTAGNAAEVHEAIELTKGTGDAVLLDLILDLGAALVQMAGLDTTKEQLKQLLVSGQVTERFWQMAEAQGASPDHSIAQAKYRRDVLAPTSGTVTCIDALTIGRAVHAAGAGRSVPGATVDASCGLLSLVDIGMHVVAGETVAVLDGGSQDKVEAACHVAGHAYITDGPAQPTDVVWVSTEAP